MATNANAMKVLARKAENQDGFLGTVLNAVAAANKCTTAEVAIRIGCSSENIPRLALCKIPRGEEAVHFSADILQISEFVGCDAGQLANLVREFQAITAMRRYAPEDSHHDTMLMAARDNKKAIHEEDGEDSE
ncbi:MAG: hypothetical protein AB2777_20500 [Candidatus Thiodiazotropha endolucinida]